MPIEPELEDLKSCWRLVNGPKRIGALPVTHPYESQLINQRLDEYLDDLRRRLANGTYAPAGAPVIEVPKGNGAIRPVQLLTLEDRVVYAYLGLICLPMVKAEIWPELRYIDFSYRFHDPIKADDWFQPYFRPWREFIAASIRQLDEGASVIVETDISAFYENIDYGILFSDLRRIAVPEPIQALLRRCLTTWFATTKRGLPQSHPTSHLLAKFYLSSIDRHLVALTPYTHRRFSDDTRFFCKSEVEGKLAVKSFISQLRDKTLNIQTAKTRFMDPETARNEFLGATPLIATIRKEYESAKTAQLEDLVYSAHYMSVAEVIQESLEQGIPPEVFWRAYDLHVVERFGGEFNKSVFHYLLGQLGRLADNYAVSDVLKRFVKQPQETENILQYLSAVDITAEEDAVLLDFLELEDNIYAFQTFQFLQYFRVKGTHDSERLRSIARRYAFAADSPPYLRSEARAVLAVYGNSTDFEAFLRSYGEARNDLERAELICALRNFETSRRNGFFSTIAGGNWLIDRAVEATKSNIIDMTRPAPRRTLEAVVAVLVSTSEEEPLL